MGIVNFMMVAFGANPQSLQNAWPAGLVSRTSNNMIGEKQRICIMDCFRFILIDVGFSPSWANHIDSDRSLRIF